MRKVIILGASGMAGHVIYKHLSAMKDYYDVGAITRNKVEGIDSIILDVEDNLPDLAEIIRESKADVVINCIGLLVKACEDCPAEAIYINSFLPQTLAFATEDLETKIIHLSTDCVFDGTLEDDKGYSETYIPDEKNWYGRTKALGEINNDKDLTLRMSIIGPELKDGVGLFHWLTKQKGEVNGYVNHYWNGITTLELAKQIDKIIRYTLLTGIYHLVSEEHITKYNLLKIINDEFQLGLEIKPFETEIVNKILSNNRDLEYIAKIPNYVEQIKELKSFMS